MKRNLLENMRRALATVLSVMMLLTSMPVSAIADAVMVMPVPTTENGGVIVFPGAGNSKDDGDDAENGGSIDNMMPGDGIVIQDLKPVVEHSDSFIMPLSILPGGNTSTIIRYEFYNKLAKKDDGTIDMEGDYDPNGVDQLIYSELRKENETLVGPARTPRSTQNEVFAGWKVREIVVTYIDEVIPGEDGSEPTVKSHEETYTASNAGKYATSADFERVFTSFGIRTPILGSNGADGKIFNDDALNAGTSIDSPTVVIKLYATFDEMAYVRFVDDEYDANSGLEEQQGRIVGNHRGAPGETFPLTQDQNYTAPEGYVLVGWKDVTNGDNGNGEPDYAPNATFTMGAYGTTTILKAVIKEGIWITYHSEGGSLVDPEYFLVGETVTQHKPDPTRVGYSFAGWYTAANGGTAFNFGRTVGQGQNQISASQDVYAHWTQSQYANFTVVFWRQSINDTYGLTDAQKSYDYWFSATSAKQARVEQGITVDNGTNQDLNPDNGYTLRIRNNAYINNSRGDNTGFYYNATKTNNEVNGKKVQADGSTVVNVYFDREPYTINFKLYKSTGMFWGDWVTEYSWTGLYGAKFNPNASPAQIWDTDYLWKTNSSNGTELTFLNAFLYEKATHSNK